MQKMIISIIGVASFRKKEAIANPVFGHALEL